MAAKRNKHNYIHNILVYSIYCGYKMKDNFDDETIQFRSATLPI